MSAANDREKRQSIIDACLRMNALGINQGTSGNISLRHHDGMLVTPTSVPYETMQPNRSCSWALTARSIRPAPIERMAFSSGYPQSPAEVNAVVHAHPPYATTLAITVGIFQRSTT